MYKLDRFQTILQSRLGGGGGKSGDEERTLHCPLRGGEFMASIKLLKCVSDNSVACSEVRDADLLTVAPSMV